ncbi:uncharacterized protein L969DRAFT_96871 [Mixia osmundae IAM 14324]|uniref:Uncharacterized protein n=1 Tax=Mixia osmundae (strain CBS 9802 / IAM 14324 / JCM 22182 / KY 12970) TaxID=764103 RepID=G7E2C1_MIXOS|nr:uncharacterized protein L969DRAFT_96871 [Mixia osmundae IAM 14324]KEI36853.1 hypothetical protein L969DRAFT_96871 [Mixia osmundae IAM 14324]GAA96981.1 hypothetical protein E5Q_03655 [Mixia osmundae IAM 14324]
MDMSSDQQSIQTLSQPVLVLTAPVRHALPRQVPYDLEEGLSSRDEWQEAEELRGGCGCLVGKLHCRSGPCICETSGSGILSILACIVIWPFNAIFGLLLGVLDCLTCGCCS